MRRARRNPPAGQNYRANRLWVLLDQLLLGPTLADAIKSSEALTAAGRL